MFELSHLQGNAGAGGAVFAIACDHVVARMEFNGPAYGAARKAFVFKEIPTETPSHLAPLRQRKRHQA